MACRHEGGNHPCPRNTHGNCRRQAVINTKAWVKANPSRVVAQRRKAKYGIDADTVNQWYIFQSGLCAACGQPLEFSKVCLDHCHATQKWRGLLHRNCNSALGMVKEQPETLEALAAYLRSHQPTLELAKPSKA